VAGDLTFVALLNESPAPRTMTLDLAAAGLALAPGETVLAYDTSADLFSRVGATLSAAVPGQTLRLFVLRRAPGVVWTTSGFEELPLAPAGTAGAGWRVRLSGPRDVRGRLEFHLPGGAPAAVLLDGAPLAALEPAVPAGVAGYSYDAATGRLEVSYAHAGLVPGGATPLRTLDVLR
jgi:hypothetical protein